MAHLHSVYDSDAHFSINPITRALRNEASSKTSLIQYDHNSERFTFEIPRMIEGHDMSLCNVIRVHYINIDSKTKAQVTGVYEVEDMQISPESDDVVICSWLISRNATQLVGSLNFLIRFSCVTDGFVDYAWNTATYTGISVSSGINADETFEDDYLDVIEQWKASVLAGFEVEVSRIADEAKADVTAWKEAESANVIAEMTKFSEQWNETLDVERARIDNLASLPEGSTTGDAELADIRVGHDGTIYDSAGAAVRGQTGTLSESLRAVTSGLLGPKQEAVILRGYVSTTNGSTASTTPSTSIKRAYTRDLIAIKGDALFIIPDGYCARVFYYTPSYERYDAEWKSGIIHTFSDEIIWVRLTFGHVDTDQEMTDDEILFIQENLQIGNLDARLYNSPVDYAQDIDFEIGGLLSATGKEADANRRIRSGYISAGNYLFQIEDGYKYDLFYYDSDYNYLGTTNFTTKNQYIDVVGIDGCKYMRIMLARYDDSATTEEDAKVEVQDSFHMFSVNVDTTLTKLGIPADAYTVGKRLETLEKVSDINPKTIRILGIGNSHTRDSLRWLWKILKESGFDDVVVGQGYWGNSTLAGQYASIDPANENHRAFTYWKYTTNQNATKTSNFNLDSVLQDEPWDIVVFQQQSNEAGQYDSFVSDAFDINDFISHVKETIGNDNLKIGIVALFSRCSTLDNATFEELWGSDPERHYQAIYSTTHQVANHMSQCDFVVNTGKAVNLGRENPFLGALGDEMIRSDDKVHLAFGIPQFMAGMVYAITLCGVKPCDISWYPTTTDEAEIVEETSAYLAYLAKQCALIASQSI